MSLVSSFTLRPYSSVSSSCCDDDAGGGGNGSSAFESYDSTNNPNHERNHPIPLSDTHPTNTLHQFIPIGNGIFAGTMLQDRPKRPASLRFELGGDRQLLPQMPMTTAQSPPREEEESEQPRTPSTLFSLNSKTEPDYKALHLQSEIRVFEHRREISRLQEEKRQLRLKLIDLQAQLLESQTAQQQQQQQRNEEDVDVPLVEDPATPQHETRHARSESKSLPQQVDGDVECPPVQMLTYSNPQQEDDQLCNEQIPVEVHDKENTNPAITATSIVLHKSNPEASSSDDCSGRKRGSRGKKRLHNNDEVAFEKPPESTPPHLVTTRRSSRRRAKTTVPTAGTTTTTTTTTPPESPPDDGLVDALARSAVRKSKRRARSGNGGAKNSQDKSVLSSSSSSPLLELLNQSCKSLSPIPMNDDEKVEHHLQLSEDNDIDDNPCSPPHGVVPATTSVGRSTNQHMAATTRTSTSPEQQQGGAGEGDAVKENVGSDNPRPKRRRQGLLLLPNSFQAPALKKKKDKKR